MSTRTLAALTGAVAASFAVLLACVVGLGKLLELAERPDGSTAFDSSITSWVVAHRTDALTTLAKVLSTIGSQKLLTPVVLVIAALLLWRRRIELASLLVIVWGGAILLYSLAKQFVSRPRPPQDIWLAHAGGKAFPSGHAVQSLATFVVLALVGSTMMRRPPWAPMLIAVVLALGVGWSRVYLGVHWTTDVLAGWLAAAAWTVVVVGLFARSTPRVNEIERTRT
jgi:membrane-associated phospholipid phosphatase